MEWIVAFVMLAMPPLPDGMTARFTASFDTLAKCEMFVDNAEENEVQILSSCEPK